MKLLAGFVLLCVFMLVFLAWMIMPAMRVGKSDAAPVAVAHHAPPPEPPRRTEPVAQPDVTDMPATVAAEPKLPDHATPITEQSAEPPSAQLPRVSEVRWADNVDHSTETALDVALRALDQDAYNTPALKDAEAAARRLEDWDTLSEILHRRLAMEPDNAEIQNEYAAVLIRTSQFMPAADLLRRVVRQHPDDTSAWYNLAVCEHTLRELHAAVRSWKRVIELTPDLPEAHIHLAEVQLDLRRWQPAADSLRRAIELDPATLEPRQNLALALWNLNQPDEALDLLEQLLTEYPRNLPTLNRLAEWSLELFETDPVAHAYRRTDAERYCRASITIAAGQADAQALLHRIIDSTTER